ncbi:hypothetical protein T265_02399 [Opisthorchis viverrini]|uniref:Uncharacterized protein n=1 Tax=Opisthorchis viverrini TaxID=6198 RepID=A0A074ZV51_OPIVI|nr:hypothetical protein T265_02399 [Opisthorchis viverrini]KER31348.1 hypothetical protein T265_02399 [Opisthorchis viverrini]
MKKWYLLTVVICITVLTVADCESSSIRRFPIDGFDCRIRVVCSFATISTLTSSNRVKSRPTNRATEKLVQKSTQTVLSNGGKTSKKKVLSPCLDSPTKFGNSPVVQKRPPINFVQNERCAAFPSPATSPLGGTVNTDWNENDLTSSDVNLVLTLVFPPTRNNFISSIGFPPESSKPIA